MERCQRAELVMIRHAPSATDGRICGRRDVAAQVAAPGLDRLRRLVGPIAQRVSSPARRCRQTTEALWPGAAVATDPRLWEQDFGAWEGRAYGDIPDLGALPPAELAAHRPPGGESFADLCARVRPALRALAGHGAPVAIVAHAGTVRAGLALALGDPGAALAVEVAPLSVTRLRWLSPETISVVCANCLP